MPVRVLVAFDHGLFTDGLLATLRECVPPVVAEVVDDIGAATTTAGRADATRLVLADVDRMGPDPIASVQRALAQLGPTPLVLFGAGADIETQDRLQRLGAAAYIPKSYNRPTILAMLRLLLGGGTPPDAAADGQAPATSLTVPGNEGAVPSLRDLGLTDAEAGVLGLAAQGKTNLEIARALGKSEGTVRIQMSAILRKLKVRNRSEAIIVAMRVIKVVRNQIAKAEQQDLDISWLLPHMEFRRFKAGHEVFHKGDVSDELYLIQRGRILLPEIDVELGEHEMFGEIGIFAPDHRRTCSAVCATDVDLFALSEDKVKQAYFLNPGFALFVIQAITRRLLSGAGRR